MYDHLTVGDQDSQMFFVTVAGMINYLIAGGIIWVLVYTPYFETEFGIDTASNEYFVGSLMLGLMAGFVLFHFTYGFWNEKNGAKHPFQEIVRTVFRIWATVLGSLLFITTLLASLFFLFGAYSFSILFYGTLVAMAGYVASTIWTVYQQSNSEE